MLKPLDAANFAELFLEKIRIGGEKSQSLEQKPLHGRPSVYPIDFTIEVFGSFFTPVKLHLSSNLGLLHAFTLSRAMSKVLTEKFVLKMPLKVFALVMIRDRYRFLILLTR